MSSTTTTPALNDEQDRTREGGVSSSGPVPRSSSGRSEPRETTPDALRMCTPVRFPTVSVRRARRSPPESARIRVPRPGYILSTRSLTRPSREKRGTPSRAQRPHIEREPGVGRGVASTQTPPFTHRIGRIPIRHLSPQQPENRWPSTAFVGEVVPFAATVFREGHDALGAEVVIATPDGSIERHALTQGAPGTDRWSVDVAVLNPGIHRWHVEAYADDWATWLHAASVKIAAGVDVELMLLEGALLLEGASRLAAEKARGSRAQRCPLGHAQDDPDSRRAPRRRQRRARGRRSRGVSAAQPAHAQRATRAAR